jgi:hypothetical protein
MLRELSHPLRPLPSHSADSSGRLPRQARTSGGWPAAGACHLETQAQDTLHWRNATPQPPFAGAAVEFQLGELEARARKKVMRDLNIIGENEGITQQAQDEYAKLFGHRPSASHIQAMTALFNWSLPEELGHDADGDLIA